MQPMQTSFSLNGRTFNVGRLPTTPATELWFLLLKGAGPAVADLVGALGLDFVGGRVVSHGVQGAGLGTAVERLVRALPFSEFQAIAQKALATTTVDGQLVWGRVDVLLSGTSQYLELVGRVLAFQYADFTDALGALLSRLGQKVGTSSSEGSNTSAGPSGA